MLKAVPMIAALIVASAFVVPTVSQAAQSSSVRVSYADLNLASQSGVSVLERRIESAAVVVCEFEDSRQIDLARATIACRDDAVAGAQPQLAAALAAARNPSVTVIGTASIVVSAG